MRSAFSLKHSAMPAWAVCCKKGRMVSVAATADQLRDSAKAANESIITPFLAQCIRPRPQYGGAGSLWLAHNPRPGHAEAPQVVARRGDA
jgi:hypothetical protein